MAPAAPGLHPLQEDRRRGSALGSGLRLPFQANDAERSGRRPDPRRPPTLSLLGPCRVLDDVVEHVPDDFADEISQISDCA